MEPRGKTVLRLRADDRPCDLDRIGRRWRPVEQLRRGSAASQRKIRP
jgi:hypothetical protein